MSDLVGELGLVPLDFNPRAVPPEDGPFLLASSFSVETQKFPSLCWAAVAVSVALHYDPGRQIKKCTLVRDVFGESASACCENLAAMECDMPHDVEDALRKNQNLRKPLALEGLTFDLVKTEVTQGKPIVVSKAQGDQTHALVVRGVSRNIDDGVVLEIDDPAINSPRETLPLTRSLDEIRIVCLTKKVTDPVEP